MTDLHRPDARGALASERLWVPWPIREAWPRFGGVYLATVTHRGHGALVKCGMSDCIGDRLARFTQPPVLRAVIRCDDRKVREAIERYWLDRLAPWSIAGTGLHTLEAWAHVFGGIAVPGAGPYSPVVTEWPIREGVVDDVESESADN